ncbi:class I SAM-dependent DNA methyltransferase [Calditrichota bacterium GD2]
MKETNRLQQVAPYSVLASIYDHVMSHVNYAMWANYIKALFKLAGRRISVIADLSCGTGSLLPHLRGYRRKALGFDLSLPMLKTANRKSSARHLICADFRQLPVKTHSLDAALTLYDSVNYLHADRDALRFFNECYRTLRPGGLLIFDIVTPYLCKTAFKEYQESAMINENLRYDRFSFFDEDENLQINQFKIWVNGQCYYEEHRQKIREVKEWILLIKQTNFKLLEIFSNFSMKPVMETSDRAHFVLRR